MAYTAPNEDTVVVVGGRGTMANAAELNGGGVTKAIWDTEADPTKFIAANGGPIAADTGITYDHTGNPNGERNFAKAGIGTNVIVGTLAYCSGTNITAGIYEVTSVDGAGAWICCNEIDATDDNADSVVNVGGAIGKANGAGLDAALANDVNNAAAYNRYIYINGDISMAAGTITTTATLDANTYSGGADTKVFVIGYNSTLAAESSIIITTAAALANGLLQLSGPVTFYEWRNIDFNGSNVPEAGDAEYCVESTATTTNTDHTWINCKFHNADNHGAYVQSSDWRFIGCEFYANGLGGAGDGVYCRVPGALFFGCSLHDNANGSGMYFYGAITIANSLIYDNGVEGLNIESVGDKSIIFGNTIYGNTSDGIFLDQAADSVTIFNNTSCGNGGYGYNLDTNGSHLKYFGYNHANGNTGNGSDTTHCTEVLDTSWATFLNGNHQSGAPNFTNVGDGTEDFTPASGSDLIDNALDAGTA